MPMAVMGITPMGMGMLQQSGQLGYGFTFSQTISGCRWPLLPHQWPIKGPKARQ